MFGQALSAFKRLRLFTETNHYGIDIGGNTGNAIFASDSGVVVYAGWNDWGYGEMVVMTMAMAGKAMPIKH